MERGPYEMYFGRSCVFQKRYAFQALLRNGITTALPIARSIYRAWGETSAEFAAAADAAEDLGLRTYLGAGLRTGNPYVTRRAPSSFTSTSRAALPAWRRPSASAGPSRAAPAG